MPGEGPLAGVRIVELGAIGPGPHAAMLLGDLGADVVRIERPGAPLRVGVGERGGLVEDEHRRVGEQGASDRHPLRLAARQVGVLADDRVVAALEPQDAVVDLCRLGGGPFAPSL